MDRTSIDRHATPSDHLRAREVAQSILDGRTTVLEAVRLLVSLAHTDAVAELEGRRFIIGLNSETDSLPVGDLRNLWAPEIVRVEELYRADFFETCRRILDGKVNE